jgi:hypothetical protein
LNFYLFINVVQYIEKVVCHMHLFCLKGQMRTMDMFFQNLLNWNTVQSGIKHHNSFFQYTCSRQHWWKDKNSYIFIEAQSINFEKTCPLSSSDLLNKTDACDTPNFNITRLHIHVYSKERW